jgi:hypothetical protein
VAFHVPVTLAERDFPTNMIVLKGQDIDVILGMNWLAQHKAILNTDLRTIRLSYGQEEVLLSIPVAIPAKPFGRVYEAIIPEIQDIPVVCEFPDVFPEDLPGLPPERDVEFVIELKPGTTPVSRRSYRMPPNELEIHYHPGKAIVVADALSRKASFHGLTMKTSDITLCQEMEKLNLGMIQHGTLNHLKLESILLQRIIDAQRNDEGMKHIHEKMEAGKANCFRKDDQGVVWFNNRIVVPKNDEVRQQILDEAHLSRYSIHPGSTKMYHDLKKHYWWTKMKIEIACYVARCDTCRCVKAIHTKTAGPMQSLPIPT